MVESKSNNNNIIIKFLFTPSTNINYDFIASIYFLFSFLCIGLYLCETQVFVQYTTFTSSESLSNSTTGKGGGGEVITEREDSNSYKNEILKELAESTQGLYLIFIPFIPCFLWSLLIRYVWKKQKLLKNDDIDEQHNDEDDDDVKEKKE